MTHPTGLPPEAIEQLREAKTVLEHQGLADRLTETIGAPIAASIRLLPESAEKMLHGAIHNSLTTALDVAIRTLGTSGPQRPRLLRHKLAASFTGAAGGAFGLPAVAAELPLSTLVILRSVADIARAEGEDLSRLESRLACLSVLAIGPKSSVEGEDDLSIGYFAVRAAIARQVAESTKYVARGGTLDAAAPPLVRLISEIAKRFGVVVSEKVAAQSVPVIGALGGALINNFFIDHYQDLARAHFTVRRLERQYGVDAVRHAYDQAEPVPLMPELLDQNAPKRDSGREDRSQD